MGTTLFSADWLVPITRPPLRDGGVCVDDSGVILAVDAAEKLARAHPKLDQVHVRGVLMPALVDAHTHVELAALKGRVPGGTGLVNWVGALMRARAEISPDERLRAAEGAIDDLWRRGVAALGNVGNDIEAASVLARQPLQGSFFHEMLGSDERATGDAMAHGRVAHGQAVMQGRWPQRFRYVQSPHAPYSADPDLLTRVFAAAARSGSGTSVHVAEDVDELDLLLRGEGRWRDVLSAMGVDPASRTPGVGPVPYLERLGAFVASPPLLVHMCHASPEDIALAAEHGATAVLCPRSNLHISGVLPPARHLVAAGVPLALGTDSLASNATHSVWDEMATLAAHVPDVPAAFLLRAATLGGANALALPSLGAIEPGKRPGLIGVEGLGADADPVTTLAHMRPPSVTWFATA